MLIYPRKVNLSFSTVPAGLTVYLDGIAKTTPFVYDTLTGFNHTIEARNQASGGTSYTFGSWSDGGAQTHTIVVPAADQSYVATFQASAAPPAIAAYAFNEGSGTTAADASGSGLTGTLTNGATWGAGRNAGAVQLDGVNDFVELGNPAALQLTGSMTVSAWVNSAAFPVDDAAIVSKRASGEVGYQLDTTVDRGPRTIGFKLTSSSGGSMFRYGATTLQANTWYHVTGVYDAATSQLHVYLNGQLDDGTLVGTVTATQQNSAANVNIGRRPTATASTSTVASTTSASTTGHSHQAEIQADMNTPVAGGTGDTTAADGADQPERDGGELDPGQPLLDGATDNVAVTGYRVERCQGAGCSIFAEIAPAAPGRRSRDTGRTRLDQLLLPRARRRRRHQPRPLLARPPARRRRRPPTRQPPTAPTNLTATAASPTQVNLSWTAATDNVAVTGYRVERCQGAGCSIFAEIAPAAPGRRSPTPGSTRLDQLLLPRARQSTPPQPRPLLRDRQRDDAGRRRHDAADGTDQPDRDARRARPRSTSPGRRRPTTSRSPATGSSAARVPAARSSPRSPSRPGRRSSIRAKRLDELLLPRARHRRRRQPRPLLRDRNRDDAGPDIRPRCCVCVQ